MIFQQIWSYRLFYAILLAGVFVLIFDWLKRAAISNFLEDHALKLEQFVFKKLIPTLSVQAGPEPQSQHLLAR